MKPLQTHIKLSQLQTRLNKQSYLSRYNLPGSADAKMFLHLQSIKKYPDRKVYPNFYHWYVLMKQFSIGSIQKWITNSSNSQNDLLIDDIILPRNHQKVLTDSVCFKKSQMTLETITEQNERNIKPQDHSHININEIQYIMDVKIKEGIRNNIKERIKDILIEQRIQAGDIHEITQQKRIRIQVKMDLQKYEQLKNKISTFQQVQTIQTKKKVKQFKTLNCLLNISQQL